MRICCTSSWILRVECCPWPLPTKRCSPLKCNAPLQDLQQSQLETVVPATEGTPVLVLAGALRGKQGRLLKRNTGECGGQGGNVQ